MISIESGILLKNHVTCNFMLKYYITLSPDNLRKLQISFFTYLEQTKIWKFVCPFDLYNWMNQISFEVILLGNVLINGDYLKNTK